jgi:acetolactate synthase-1/2/3 large subunit
LVETLRELGVRHVFGVPSGGWVEYMEALRTTPGIEFILTTHEGAAGMMADVCGRLTGAPGACFGTYGPGATNLATGVGEALLDRSPVIAFTDEMPEPMRGRTTQMGIDHQALFAPITKRTTRLTAERVRETLLDAAETALTPRFGPVHVGLPTDLSTRRATPSAAAPARPVQPRAPDALIAAASERLAAARKPLMAIGLGAVRSGVGAQAVAIAEARGMPVVLTPMAKGVLAEDHPLYAGVLFHALSDLVGQTHQQADLVVAVGYDPVEFNYEGWLSERAALVSLDDEPADIDRAVYEVAVDAPGDIGASLARLVVTAGAPNDWDQMALAQRRDEMFARLAPSAAGFGPKGALAVLRGVLPDDGIMTCDVGAHTHLIGQLWRTPAPGLQIMTNGWSTMGFGVPAAIAAKLVHPQKAVCAVVGDGGFLMTAGEIATAVRYGVKFVTVVLTDNDLALIRIKQQKKQYPIYGTPVRARGKIGGPDIFGAEVFTADDAESFRAALVRAFAADGPVIVEALVDSREYDEVVLHNDKP